MPPRVDDPRQPRDLRARHARARAQRDRRLADLPRAQRAQSAAHAVTIARMMEEDRPPAASRIDAAVPWVLTLDARAAHRFARLVLAEIELRAAETTLRRIRRRRPRPSTPKGSNNHGERR